MLYLPSTRYEVAAWNLGSRDNIGRDLMIKAMRERHYRLSGNRKKGPNASRAMYADDVASGGRGRGRGG